MNFSCFLLFCVLNCLQFSALNPWLKHVFTSLSKTSLKILFRTRYGIANNLIDWNFFYKTDKYFFQPSIWLILILQLILSIQSNHITVSWNCKRPARRNHYDFFFKFCGMSQIRYFNQYYVFWRESAIISCLFTFSQLLIYFVSYLFTFNQQWQ